MFINNILKVILTLFGTIIVGLIGTISLLFLFTYTLFSGACTNEILSTNDSSNGRYTAYIFTRDCGATTSVSYQLSILKKDKKFKNKSGNTFVSKQEFDVEWEDDTQLSVVYPELSETYEMDKKVGRVVVVYKTR
jgi:hypothetical protein